MPRRHVEVAAAQGPRQAARGAGRRRHHRRPRWRRPSGGAGLPRSIRSSGCRRSPTGSCRPRRRRTPVATRAAVRAAPRCWGAGGDGRRRGRARPPGAAPHALARHRGRAAAARAPLVADVAAVLRRRAGRRRRGRGGRTGASPRSRPSRFAPSAPVAPLPVVRRRPPARPRPRRSSRRPPPPTSARSRSCAICWCARRRAGAPGNGRGPPNGWRASTRRSRARGSWRAGPPATARATSSSSRPTSRRSPSSPRPCTAAASGRNDPRGSSERLAAMSPAIVSRAAGAGVGRRRAGRGWRRGADSTGAKSSSRRAAPSWSRSTTSWGGSSIRGTARPGEIHIVAEKRAATAEALGRLRVHYTAFEGGEIVIDTRVELGGRERSLPLAGSGIDLVLEVPPEVAVQAKTFGGDLSASGLRAGARLETTGGRIGVSDVRGPVVTRQLRGGQRVAAVDGRRRPGRCRGGHGPARLGRRPRRRPAGRRQHPRRRHPLGRWSGW